MVSAKRLFRQHDILVLGLGNLLLKDDGVGVHALRALEDDPEAVGLELVDGGTIGFRLTGLLAECSACIVIDAADLQSAPGTVRVMDIRDVALWCARGDPVTVHEAGLASLLRLLHLEEHLPTRFSVIAVQPATIDLGEGLTWEVEAALPAICAAVTGIARDWSVA